jgi:hypothetical protein
VAKGRQDFPSGSAARLIGGVALMIDFDGCGGGTVVSKPM